MSKKPYLHNRIIEEHPDGFYIITPEVFDLPTPLYCPVCSSLFRTSDDDQAWREDKCCYRCQLNWVSPRRAEWKRGWRPDFESLKKEIENRPPIKTIFR